MLTDPNSTTGFVYVATGGKYVAEATVSAASLRRHHPAAKICLITDQPPGEKFWDDLIILPEPRFGFRDKIEMRLAPYARCVFLDTDTTIVADLSQLFLILTHYDVAGVQLAEGQDYLMEGGIPAAFPEMNSGVIAYRIGAATEEFFKLWVRYYEEFRALNCDGHYHYANVGDQKSLRAALWHSSVRHTCLGGEFNFIPFRIDLLSMQLAVVHTRTKRDLTPLAARLNAKYGRRVYIPTLDVVITDNIAGHELRRLTIALSRQLLRAAGRMLVPRGLRDWLRHRRASGWLFGNRYAPTTPVAGEKKWEIGK